MLCNTHLLKNFGIVHQILQSSKERRVLFLFLSDAIGKLKFGSDNNQCALFLKVFLVALILNVLVRLKFNIFIFIRFCFRLLDLFVLPVSLVEML